jgi:AraC-like DNA-binding protein
MRNLFALIILLYSGFISAETLSVDQQFTPTLYNGKPCVLIHKGDDPAYAARDFDDTAWRRIALPSDWNRFFPGYQGVCWYRIHFTTPATLPPKTLGISLGVISDVDEIFLNGTRIGGYGSFPPHHKPAYDRARLYELPGHLLVPGDNNVIALRVRSFYRYESGPNQGLFAIGSYTRIHARLYARELLDLAFIMIYITVALYFAAVFFRNTADREYLFFALFCLTTAAYLFMWTQTKYLLSGDFFLLKRMEYSLIIVTMPLMLVYITTFFKRPHTLLHWIFYGISGISLVAVLASGNIRLWNRIFHILTQPSWILPVGYCLYAAAKESKYDRNAKYILASFLAASLFLMNDILILRNVYSFTKLSGYGFFLIIVASAVIIRGRYVALYSEIESLRERSRKKNASITEDAKRKIQEVVEYLESNYTREISREGLAEMLSIHPDYLGKLFKVYIGKSMNEYINDLRIKRSIELLKLGESSVIDIAFSVGYENLSTYYRAFQSVTGRRPSDYQKGAGAEDEPKEQ